MFDSVGAHNLKIVVCGGFSAERIELFEKLEAPVNIYGVGSMLLKQKIDITADIVIVDGKVCAKYGRKPGDFSKLEKVR